MRLNQRWRRSWYTVFPLKQDNKEFQLERTELHNRGPSMKSHPLTPQPENKFILSIKQFILSHQT